MHAHIRFRGRLGCRAYRFREQTQRRCPGSHARMRRASPAGYMTRAPRSAEGMVPCRFIWSQGAPKSETQAGLGQPAGINPMIHKERAGFEQLTMRAAEPHSRTPDSNYVYAHPPASNCASLAFALSLAYLSLASPWMSRYDHADVPLMSGIAPILLEERPARHASSNPQSFDIHPVVTQRLTLTFELGKGCGTTLWPGQVWDCLYYGNVTCLGHVRAAYQWM
ncbi:hypothetical protein C8R44DRAFT_737118 [Mycena epipterygia]|nr:hypothetical protein C8R44DRAFT_737118 [Mycena epipterygia]